MDEKATKNSKRLIAIELCIFLSGLSVFSQLYLYQPLLPVIATEFHTTIGNSSILVSSSTIGMAIGLLFFAFKADNYPRKQLMVFSLLSSSLLTLFSFWIDNLTILILIGFLKGFLLSGVSAVILAYIIEEVSLTVLGTVLSLYLSGNTLGGMFGRVITILVSGGFGWKIAVLVIGLESLLLAVLFWKFFPESRFFTPEKINIQLKLKQMKQLVTEPYLLKLYLIGALLMGCFVSVYNYLTFRLEQPPFSLDHIFIAFIFLMYIFGVFGTMVSGKLSSRISPRYILKSEIILMFLGVFCLISQNLSLTIFGLAFFTISFFGAHTMASRMVALHTQEGRSSATSLYWLFYYIGSSTLGTGTGYLLNATNWTYFIFLLAGMISISFLLSFNKNINN